MTPTFARDHYESGRRLRVAVDDLIDCKSDPGQDSQRKGKNPRHGEPRTPRAVTGTPAGRASRDDPLEVFVKEQHDREEGASSFLYRDNAELMCLELPCQRGGGEPVEVLVVVPCKYERH